MTNEKLSEILSAFPDEARVYFEVPETEEGLAASVVEYNSITNEILLKWDCAANYDFDLSDYEINRDREDTCN